MFKVLLTFVVGLFLSAGAFAQQITVKGIVKDSSGEPIIGANVVVKGTTNGTITDFDGNFQLSANTGEIIQFSFIGYTTQELPATAEFMNIIMKDDSEMLNEVVTDYFATLMCQRRAITNQPEIVNSQTSMSAYSDLFGVMNKFLTYYLPELKEIILRQFPTEEFKRIIGERLYEKLAAMCSLKIALNHDKQLHEMAQKRGVPLNNLLA